MAVAEGEQQGETAVERVRTLDFSQPTKFTTELRRRIGRALDPFCDALGAWLAGELRSDVELSLTDIGQHTWAAAKARLPADAIAVDVQAESIERHMLLSVELAFVLQALECLLGGDAAQAPPLRHLTEIDWVLTRGLLDAIVNELSGAWAEIDGPQLTRGEVDTEGDAGVFTPVGEPTLSVTFRCTIDGLSSAMSLLIPWSAIEPVVESMRGAGGLPTAADAQGTDALRRACSRRRFRWVADSRGAAARAVRSSCSPPANRPAGRKPMPSSVAPSWNGLARTSRPRARAPRAARSCAASSCACGPSWAGPTFPSAGRWSWRRGRSWSSTSWPTRRWSCSPTACALPTAASW